MYHLGGKERRCSFEVHCPSDKLLYPILLFFWENVRALEQIPNHKYEQQ